MIEVGCESLGLYHLAMPGSPMTGIMTDSPDPILICLGHSNLSKLKDGSSHV